jgi:hypothetical protein
MGISVNHPLQQQISRKPSQQPLRNQPQSGLIHHMHIVMVFGPIVAFEDHRSLLDRLCGATTFEPEDTRRQPNGSVLNRHDIPPEQQVASPTGRGTI